MRHAGKGKPSAIKAPSVATGSVPGVEQKIRQRAYELYETRGRGDGHDLDDWLAAESELKGQKLRAAPRQ